jgi:Rieske [2Fe-2S] domain
MTPDQGLGAHARRKRGIALIALAGVIVAGAALAFVLLAGGPADTIPPQEVALASDVTATPIAASVRARDGADRLLQRERTGRPCSTAEPALGCPLSTPVQMVPLFLVRDSAGAIRAFIGEDPRNSCKLLWRTDVQSGVFYDPCHGSLYNRQGRVVGGPSPWNLNEWAVGISDGKVSVDPSKILTGQAPGLEQH